MSDIETSEILKSLSEVNARLASINTKLDVIDSLETRIRHTLYGNGKPGLVMQVDRLDQQASRNRWFMRAVIVALIAVIVAAFVEHWRVYHDLRASMNQASPTRPIDGP